MNKKIQKLQAAAMVERVEFAKSILEQIKMEGFFGMHERKGCPVFQGSYRKLVQAIGEMEGLKKLAEYKLNELKGG